MISIVKHRRVWFVLSGAMVVVSLLLLAVFGLKVGIDFTGGSLLEVHYMVARPTQEAVRGILDAEGLNEASVQLSGEENVLVRARPMTEAEHQSLLVDLQTLGALEEIRFDSIGPVIGEELKKKSLTALVLILLMIIVYVGWSFRGVSHLVSSWKYGAVTVVAGLHDVVIPLGVFAVLGAVADVPVGTAFVAAILTILGYSVNDTIVVLDRVRENLLHKAHEETFEAVVEKSIRQTIARSLNTTITTLLALVAVFLFGGDSTRYFALALLFGIAVGAYSSIFTAAPLLVSWEKWNTGSRGL